MGKVKIDLKELKVQSFVTAFNDGQEKGFAGGSATLAVACCSGTLAVACCGGSTLAVVCC